MSHTPAPWKAEKNPEKYNSPLYAAFTVFTEDEGGGLVADILHDGGGRPEANARLIASAPELLEALKALIEADPRTVGIDHYTRAVADAGAAIQKAAA